MPSPMMSAPVKPLSVPKFKFRKIYCCIRMNIGLYINMMIDSVLIALYFYNAVLYGMNSLTYEDMVVFLGYATEDIKEAFVDYWLLTFYSEPDTIYQSLATLMYANTVISIICGLVCLCRFTTCVLILVRYDNKQQVQTLVNMRTCIIFFLIPLNFIGMITMLAVNGEALEYLNWIAAPPAIGYALMIPFNLAFMVPSTCPFKNKLASGKIVTVKVPSNIKVPSSICPKSMAITLAYRQAYRAEASKLLTTSPNLM